MGGPNDAVRVESRFECRVSELLESPSNSEVLYLITNNITLRKIFLGQNMDKMALVM